MEILQQWTRRTTSLREGEVVRYQRTFPDGTDVHLSICRVHGEFVLLDSAESRTSGPVEVTRGRFHNLSDAEAAVASAAAEWERDLR